MLINTFPNLIDVFLLVGFLISIVVMLPIIWSKK
jgi:hypothetical protein